MTINLERGYELVDVKEGLVTLYPPESHLSYKEIIIIVGGKRTYYHQNKMIS